MHHTAHRLLHVVRPFVVFAMMVMMVACSKNDEPESSKYSRSVLVYLSAQNTLAGNVDNDVVEILESVSAMGENDRLVLFLDDNNHSRFYEISKKTTGRTLYNLTPVYQYENNLNSATPEIFEQVLSYFFQHYTAENYGLVMWSHGSGWINANSVPNRASHRSFAVDTNQVTLITQAGVVELPLCSKEETANLILDHINSL